MRVFELIGDSDSFDSVVLRHDDDWDLIERFDGRPVTRFWDEVQADVVVPAGEKRIGISETDFPVLAYHAPVFSSRAVSCLRDLLDPNGELFKLSCEQNELYIFNVTNVVSALDGNNSEISFYERDRMIMSIDRYEFIPEELEGLSIFKIPQNASQSVFVTDVFVERVRECQLNGFVFNLVWSD